MASARIGTARSRGVHLCEYFTVFDVCVDMGRMYKSGARNHKNKLVQVIAPEYIIEHGIREQRITFAAQNLALYFPVKGPELLLSCSSEICQIIGSPKNMRGFILLFFLPQFTCTQCSVDQVDKYLTYLVQICSSLTIPTMAFRIHGEALYVAGNPRQAPGDCSSLNNCEIVLYILGRICRKANMHDLCGIASPAST